MPLFTQMSGGWLKSSTATVIGDVRISAGASVWFNAVVRGDVAPITVGANVNIQDGSIVHCDSGEPMTIGDNVTIGHNAILHGAEVGDGALIGMGAVLLQRTKIGREAIVAAGAVVPPNMVVPDRMLVAGVPAKVLRPVTQAELDHMRHNNAHYVDLARRYVNGEFAEKI